MEFVQLGQYIAAFALVVGLIGLMGVALRKYASPAMRVRSRKEARLELVESLPIDARSRLLLVRRDDTEHLLVKSGDRFMLVEGDITAEWEEEYTEEGSDEGFDDEGLDDEGFDDEDEDAFIESSHSEPKLSLGRASSKERGNDAA